MDPNTALPPDAGAGPATNGFAPSDPGSEATASDSSGMQQEQRLTDADRARRWQSSATKATAELKALKERLGPMLPILGQVDGTLLNGAFNEYTMLSNDPTVGPALRSYRETGRFQLTPAQQAQADAAAATADEYLTDTERAMQNRINHLESLVQTQTQNFGTQSLSQHLEHVFTDYDIRPGPRADQVKNVLIQQVNQWSHLQANGTPQEREAATKALLDLQRPTGRETVEMLVTRALGRKGLLEIAREQVAREGRTRAGMATDGPSQFGTTGNEPAPRYSGKNAVLDAIRDAEARPELLGRYR